MWFTTVWATLVTGLPGVGVTLEAAVKVLQYYQGHPSEQDVLELIPRGLALSAEPKTMNWLCHGTCKRKGKMSLSLTFPTGMEVKLPFRHGRHDISAMP